MSMKTKKMLILACLAVALFAMAGCQNNAKDETETQSTDSVMQIGNPWQDCKDIKEAEKNAGFSFDSIKSAEINSVRCMLSEEFNLIEARFFDGDNEIIIRKSNSNEDNSGNYNDFYKNEILKKNDVDILLKGNDDKFSVASWMKNGYAYSIQSSDEIEKEILQSYIDVVFEE